MNLKATVLGSIVKYPDLANTSVMILKDIFGTTDKITHG